jgi:hypothetical protein
MRFTPANLVLPAVTESATARHHSSEVARFANIIMYPQYWELSWTDILALGS